ncbi:MAG: EAL domain-containing protein [Oscillospiraceae bacterium]|nr:EAL domain-containing protein [Oscillospiraceae bacterium]
MIEQNWKRKEYETWDEAFRGLAPAIRQQSVRVAAYTQVLFVQAVKLHFGANTKDGQERMKGQYADFMYKCGMYHQLGKSLVPPEYQVWQESFTEEEQAVYKKYTTDGRNLVAMLQEKGARVKEKRKDGSFVERPTKNLPWLIMRECCQQHMERWDGSGYPEKRLGSDISAPAQIVGLAKELDRLASETKAENPFDIAFDALVSASGKDWSPELIDVLKAAKENCYAVYYKYITYTRTIPKTIPLVERRADRVMGLKYRPMLAAEQNNVVMYEANAWFGGVADRPGETETVDDLHELFKRTNIVEDVSWYLLYEAADTVLRMQNCRLDLQGVVLKMLPEFYQLGSQLQRFTQLFKEQPIDKDKLMLTIPEEVLKSSSKTVLEVVERYLRHGIVLVVDDFHPDPELSAERLLEMGITRVRMAPDMYQTAEGKSALNDLRSKGITVFGKQADSPETLDWLGANGVFCSSGTMVGVEVSEDEMILDSLAREEL